MNDSMSRAAAAQQVRLMARRTAALYDAFAQTLVDELGRETAIPLIQKAIQRYGEGSGRAVREGVTKQGLEHTPANYSSVPDLPAVGWEMSACTADDGELTIDVHYCPLAEYWMEGDDWELARLYCHVDQAKFSEYNEHLECLHTQNMLDGDDICTLLIRRKENSGGEAT